jgi:ferric-dicitrate binding protein FerR (iron transport regulator)
VSGVGNSNSGNDSNGDGGNEPGTRGARWLEGQAAPGAQALRRALDEAAGDEGATAFARQRVWNRVQVPWAGEPPAAPEPAPARWPARLGLTALAAASAVALVLGGLYLAPRLLPAPQVTVAPPTTVAPGTRPDVVPLPPPASIALTTGPGERAERRLARGVAVALSPRSALIPGDDSAPPEVKVGRVRFQVPHQAPGRRYVVRAGGYQVVVLGTTFDVAVEEAGVGVYVASGVVAVEDAASGRQLARLEPGMRWASDPEPARAERAPPASRRLSAALRAPAVRDPQQRRALDEAEAARRGGDPQAALARYRRLYAGGGPQAEVALYEMAVIQAEDLHDWRQALDTWDRYRQQHPAGLLRPEADLSVIEALTRLGAEARALAEARAFLARHPASERRAEVARVAGDIQRRRGDCRSAIASYDIAAGARQGTPDVDDASFHRAACLAWLGDARAPAAARDYLSRFPFGRHAAEVQRLLAGAKVDPGGQ